MQADSADEEQYRDQIYSLNRQSYALFAQKKDTAAAQDLERACQLALRTNQRFLYLPLLNLSTYYLKNMRAQDALRCLLRLHAACKQFYDPSKDNDLGVYLAPVYYNTGLAHTQLGNYQEAVRNFRKAVKQYRKFSPIQETICVMMEAAVQVNLSPLRAIRLLEFSIVQFQLLESDLQYMAKLKLAGLLAELGEKGSALAILETVNSSVENVNVQARTMILDIKTEIGKQKLSDQQLSDEGGEETFKQYCKDEILRLIQEPDAMTTLNNKFLKVGSSTPSREQGSGADDHQLPDCQIQKNLK